MNSLLESSTSFESGAECFVAFPDFNFFKDFSNQQTLQPELLTDKSRLPEIYDLRLNVWEHSGTDKFVNRELYPNGWYDHLDESAYHWIVIDDKNKIIASARLNIFHSLEEFPYYLSVKNFLYPDDMPFAFFSRLVVDPQHRQNGLSRKLYTIRARFCDERRIRWSQVFINNPFITVQFEKSGYKNIGQALVSYHPCSDPHSVNVFMKQHDCL